MTLNSTFSYCQLPKFSAPDMSSAFHKDMQLLNSENEYKMCTTIVTNQVNKERGLNI
jgi:hypothetical protein